VEPNVRTAWITYQDYLDSPDEAARLAVGQVLDAARRSHTEPGVVATDLDPLRLGPPALTAFAKTYPRSTPSGRSLPSGPRPVLTWAPNYQTMTIAAEAAGGSLLVAVEAAAPSLLGWAIHTQAVNLVTTAVTPDTRSPDLVADLERLKWVGHHGWTDEAGQAEATDLLSALADRGELDRDIVLGTMLAMGVGHRNLARLDALVGAATEAEV
jgi:hypothetical protein